FCGAPTEPRIRAAVEEVASTLERLGHHVQEASPVVNEESLRACLEAVWSVDLAGLAGTFARIMGREAGPDAVEAASWACIRRGREVSALDLEAAASVVNWLSVRWGGLLDGEDLVRAPTSPG